MEASSTIPRPLVRHQPGAQSQTNPPAPRLATTEPRETDRSISITFELSTNSMVTLALFNEEGVLIDIPFEGWLWPGIHEVVCRVRCETPGRYKCLLDTPTVRLVRYVDISF